MASQHLEVLREQLRKPAEDQDARVVESACTAILEEIVINVHSQMLHDVLTCIDEEVEG